MTIPNGKTCLVADADPGITRITVNFGGTLHLSSDSDSFIQPDPRFKVLLSRGTLDLDQNCFALGASEITGGTITVAADKVAYFQHLTPP